ncbi:hypothetical protein I8J29_07095 [Paenibacillus sp. MWE-103]|uniref:Uncharacterized protein n=1 Tax=Paenibacillus artemisiicola TaxID=1172618 RepID=A0ABS3W6Y4_9BACL|nr:hypothetical protein [Paenibacillus artemisiicola]MBO7743951.1 hypothetical protein [Paenibacillus artemisiicola]
MFVALVIVCIAGMMLVDYKDGKGEGPRPVRTKLLYGALLALTVYHMTRAAGAFHLFTYYDTANALFGPMADALYKWFQAKG